MKNLVEESCFKILVAFSIPVHQCGAGLTCGLWRARAPGTSKWAGHLEVPEMAWTLVAPDGVMHVISTDAELTSLCNAQRPPLRVDNMRHLLRLFDGNGHAQHVKGWQRLQDMQWLKRAGAVTSSFPSWGA